MFGNFLGDLSHGIIYWCIEDTINFNKCRNFVQAYISERKLTAKEIDYLYDQTLLIAWIHALHLLEDGIVWTKNLDQLKLLLV